MNYIAKARQILSQEIDVDEDLLDLYALLVLTTGVRTTLQDVHEAWGIWINRQDPGHKSLIPFAELAPNVQELDRVYAEAIQKTAAEMFNYLNQK